MSERCAFTSEYIYNDEDYKTLRNAFKDRNDKYLCVSTAAKYVSETYYEIDDESKRFIEKTKEIPDVFEMPIIQGKTAALSDDWEICSEIENVLNGIKTNDPVRFFVIRDGGKGLYVVEKNTEGEVTLYYIDEQAIKKGEL